MGGRLLISTDAGATWRASEQPIGVSTARGSFTAAGGGETLPVAGGIVLCAIDGGKTIEWLL